MSRPDGAAQRRASPEYAHGVSGVMKNALDWMVASAVFADKPVVLWNASPRAVHAMAALRATLTVMASRLIDTAGLALLIRPPPDAPGAAPLNPDPETMRSALAALQAHLLAARRAG
jgi:NAD(P)H-dependent FMN reductase